MYVLLQKYINGEHGVSEDEQVSYECSGTITDILTAISSGVERHLEDIKADTFRVETYECITVEYELRTAFSWEDYEKVRWYIIPINKTEILLW